MDRRRPPYGLLIDPTTEKLVHDPEHADYARLIADEALAGTSLVKIAIDRVEVTKGVRGQRIIPEQRIHIQWAKPAAADTAG